MSGKCVWSYENDHMWSEKLFVTSSLSQQNYIECLPYFRIFLGALVENVI